MTLGVLIQGLKIWGFIAMHLTVMGLFVPWLDVATGGGPPIILFSGEQTPYARVKEARAMPEECKSILHLDGVNSSELAGNCSDWCHETLGPNSGTPYMLSPAHMSSILWSDSRATFMACFKAQTGAWARWCLPHKMCIYLWAMGYGIWSFGMFCWTFWQTPRQSLPGGPAEGDVTAESPYARKCCCCKCCCCSVQPKGWNAPCLCFPVWSDRGGSETNLWISAVALWLEPFGDVVSILTLFRNGQPFPASFMVLGVAWACLLSRDPLQLGGARAMAVSLRQGFESLELLQHKARESLEAQICTSVQVYALMALHLQNMDAATVLPLAFSAMLSIATSIPGGAQAGQAVDLLEDKESWNFQDLQKAKKVTWQKKAFSMTFCPCIGTIFALVLQLIKGTLSGLELSELWGMALAPYSWDQRLSALVLGSFRCLMLCGCVTFCMPFFLAWLVVVFLGVCSQCYPALMSLCVFPLETLNDFFSKTFNPSEPDTSPLLQVEEGQEQQTNSPCCACDLHGDESGVSSSSEGFSDSASCE